MTTPPPATADPNPLPCPFCGGESTAITTAFGGACYVECLNPKCDTCGPTGKSRADAVAAWNRRAGDVYGEYQVEPPPPPLSPPPPPPAPDQANDPLAEAWETYRNHVTGPAADDPDSVLRGVYDK